MKLARDSEREFIRRYLEIYRSSVSTSVRDSAQFRDLLAEQVPSPALVDEQDG